MNKTLYTKAEVARIFGVSHKTIRNRIADGTIRAEELVQCGPTVYVKSEAVTRLMDTRPKSAAGGRKRKPAATVDAGTRKRDAQRSLERRLAGTAK